MIASLAEITCRTELRPGDIGTIVHLHGVLYHREYGYSLAFESYVAAGFAEFYRQYDAERDAVWLMEHDGQPAGFLLGMHRDGNMAQLRFFFVVPGFRGLGLGKKLMRLFVTHLRQKAFRGAYLWTTNEQQTAAGLYRAHGFALTESHFSEAFGKPLYEQKYELLMG